MVGDNPKKEDLMSDMQSEDTQEYRRLLDEIGEEYCKKGTYCIFKEFLIAAHPSRRLLIQLKLCDKMKFVWSDEVGYNVGWQTTMERWVAEGYATFFAEAYNEESSSKEIFVKTMEIRDQSRTALLMNSGN
jgi:hypothetical protein